MRDKTFTSRAIDVIKRVAENTNQIMKIQLSSMDLHVTDAPQDGTTPSAKSLGGDRLRLRRRAGLSGSSN